MSLSSPFIRRPVATTLLTMGIVLAGILSFRLLPVSPLPQVDYPTISVNANLPGASPETMAATVATPLERTLGRIAGITEMTSSSSLGSTRITLQFDLSRNIDGAARDVQAAINAARSLLPTGLPNNPTYRKVNPSDAPVIILSMTSDTLTQGQIYDSASTILAQAISQVDGVGQVDVGGSSLPAVRVELNPDAINHYGIATSAVRTAIATTNANRPKGALDGPNRHWQLAANDQAKVAADYMPIVVSYHNGSPVRLSDIATVTDSVQDLRNAGLTDGQPAVQLFVRRQPGANVIDTVDRVKALLPVLQASIPRSIDLKVASDSTTTIRASLRDVERTLVISISLVVMVVFLFLRRWRAAVIPAVAVPASLIGTFAVMYLAGYSLDNLSLMALTIATGFVVDDAVVVLENVSRHIEDGMKPFEAALLGAREVGFTVLSMSISLIAVFVPILMMGGILGRLFREFAITLSAAILVSLVMSLTTTPMMCARILRPESETKESRWSLWVEAQFEKLKDAYERTLRRALRNRLLVFFTLAFTVLLNFYLVAVIPKGFMPQQDNGRLVGNLVADQSISFQAMRQKLVSFVGALRQDPAVDHVVAFTGGGQRNGAFYFVILRPLEERKVSADEVVTRLRRNLSHIPGANLFLQAAQDIRVGGRSSNAQYQYTLSGDDITELRQWEPKIRLALLKVPEIVDVSSDQQDMGLQTSLVVDRDAAMRLGINLNQLDSTLNDLFGQRQVSTIYNPLNQYHVVMEVAPKYWQSPDELAKTYVVSASGAEVPLSNFAHWGYTNTALAVNHQGQFVATTMSFNLAPGKSLSTASRAIELAMARLGVPTSIHGSFQGTAQAYQAALANEPFLISAALLAIYLVLGILYESLVHPLTIISTVFSASSGALLALMVSNIEFSIMGLIGVFLLIGIVKKNAILMIDFAIEERRRTGAPADEAIFRACLLRFRPIMMTTMAALLGAVPLALGTGYGSELRRPLGVAIVGGLIVSQVLTLYTTPVVYIYLDTAGEWAKRQFRRLRPRPSSASTASAPAS
ncbi:MAG TPA: multidrug efflux RND transporter permease subunit [Candidatus Didemnitutus sp.]|nr:multidrug efflux RND transporter permease subunit [Candidatus Didemnitutus sp.]